MAELDLAIRGGTLVDGTGTEPFQGDLGLRDGRIVAVGRVDASATRTLDAEGRIVAPGFIDVHTHYDAQLLWDPMMTISPWHGVTSVVIGNCGFGIAPTRPEHRDLILRTLENVEGMSLEALRTGLGEDWSFESFPEYLDAIEAQGIAINVGAMIGHTPLRMYVMGDESTEREATDAEIAQMKAIVSEALEAGAIGFATSKSPTHVGYGGRPVPSRVASHGEIQALVDCLADVDHGVLQATAGRGLFLSEFAELQQRYGRPVTWTALLGGMLGPDGHRRVLEESARMAREGVSVIPQVACRPLLFEFDFSAPFPFESLALFKPVSQADRAGRKRIYADPEFRRAFREREQGGGIAGRWEDTVISFVPGHPELEERNASEVARERGVHPVDLVLDLALGSDLEARFRIAVANTDEDIVAELLRNEHTVLGLSDAGAHASQLCDACFSTHLLGHWVREKDVLSLAEAVYMLCGRPAEVFGITDRGRLAPGLAADVTVFDPRRVGCSSLRRVNDLPAGAQRLVADASGIEAVIVNGTPIRERGEDVVDAHGTLPGRVLRGGCAS